MRILNFTLIICLLVACSDQSDQIENSIKLKDVDAGEDLQLLRKDFQEQVLNPHPDVYVVVGGGHTATLIMNRNLNDKMGHLSTGGGACLNYLAGRMLPGIASLEYSAEKFKLKISQTITDN